MAKKKSSEECVVINPNARFVVLPNVEPLMPGRNRRNKASVMAALKCKQTKAQMDSLKVTVEDLGDPETESESQSISNVLNTYDVDELKTMLEGENRPAVISAIEKQIKKVTTVPKDEDQPEEV